MTPDDLTLLQNLWQRLVGSRLDAEKLADRIRHDGGLDTADITLPVVRDLLAGTCTRDATPIRWAMSELLAFYAALARDPSSDFADGPRIAACWFAIVVGSDLVAAEDDGFDRSHLDAILERLGPRLTAEEFSCLLRKVYGPPQN